MAESSLNISLTVPLESPIVENALSRCEIVLILLDLSVFVHSSPSIL